MNNIDLKNIYTDNFNLQEFANSKDHNRIKLNLDLIFKLQQLREIVGSINVTSGYRTPEFNARKDVGGSQNSNHIKGLAADVQFDFAIWNRKSLMKVLKYLGFKNVGFYWSGGYVGKNLFWIHLDIGTPHKGKFCVMDWNTRGKLIKMEGYND